MTANQVRFGTYPAGQVVSLGSLWHSSQAIEIQGANVPKAYAYIPSTRREVSRREVAVSLPPREKDDFGRPETAFTICTFWYIDALALLGRRDEARRLFESLLQRRNALGLLSEDIHPETGELWGNYPQTYSLVGLINCAMRLSRTWDEAL